MFDNMINNENIKSEIDSLCKNLLMENVNEFINTPVILAFYLGEETYDVVNASLKDAFTTSFKIEPSVYDILISDPQTDGNYINEKVIEAIQTVVDQGKSYEDLRIVFIGLMDDPVLCGENAGLVPTIREAFEQLSSYGMSLKKTSFYGIFRQSKMKEDYGAAFQFINEGKDIWKNIYHIEMTVFTRTIHLYTQLIAINVFSDDYSMTQDMNAEEYGWKSIYLHYLRVPELIITRVVREIYSNQINGKNIDYDEWADNIKKELGKIFNDLYSRSEYDCDQFIPLNYYENAAPAQTKGFLFKKAQTAAAPVYSEVIKDKISLMQILDQLYGEITLKEKDYSGILEQIISSATSIDNDHNKISQFVRKILNGMVYEYENHLENLKTKVRLSQEISSGDVGAYIRSEYEKKKMLLITQKKIEIINSLITQLSNGTSLSSTISDICQKNKKYTDILDELSKNEYGGTLEHFHIQNLPNFQVNQSIREILQNLDKDMLHRIMNDQQTINDKLEQFLTTTDNSLGNKHNLGQINSSYNTLEQISAAVLMTPVQGENPEIQSMVSKYPSMYIKTNGLYRGNTFYIISGRKYSSDRYIVRYKRGE